MRLTSSTTGSEPEAGSAKKRFAVERIRFAFCAPFGSELLCFGRGTSCNSFVLKCAAMFTNLTTLDRARPARYPGHVE